MNITLFIVLYLFFSVFTFTIFMGVTIGNLIFNIILTLFILKQDYITIKQYRILSFITLLGANLTSAYIALNDQYTAANLEGMLSLNFAVTTPMIYGIIIIGGTLLLYLNDFSIRYISNKTSK